MTVIEVVLVVLAIAVPTSTLTLWFNKNFGVLDRKLDKLIDLVTAHSPTSERAAELTLVFVDKVKEDVRGTYRRAVAVVGVGREREVYDLYEAWEAESADKARKGNPAGNRNRAFAWHLEKFGKIKV